MINPDILTAIKPVVDAFNKLSITYYIGGSIASSIYGTARATLDVDIIADITLDRVSSLVRYLIQEYYIDEQMIMEAIRRSASFNLIHLETMIKIDVFIKKKDDYNELSFERKRRDTLVDGDEESDFYFASPEDIILNKLQWYKAGDQVSERQWLDIIGVIKVQNDSLNTAYLKQWAEILELFSLLKKAFADAGFNFEKNKY